MKEPGLDGRYRDQHAPKAGEIRQKRSDTLNGNLPQAIPQFRADATLGRMREKTGQVSERGVRRVAAIIRPYKLGLDDRAALECECPVLTHDPKVNENVKPRLKVLPVEGILSLHSSGDHGGAE